MLRCCIKHGIARIGRWEILIQPVDVAVKTLEKRFRIDRREIAYLKFVLEGYDGLAVLTTLDAKTGLVALYVAPGCESEADEIMKDLGRDIMIEPAV